MATGEKKKILGVKLDPVIRETVERRCSERGCNVSDYVRELISRDIVESADKPTPKGKLIIVENNEGKIPKGEIVTGTRRVHVLDEKGKHVRTNIYESGKLKYSEELLPTSPGGKSRVILYR
jgi:hypothetical protein